MIAIIEECKKNQIVVGTFVDNIENAKMERYGGG